MLLTSCSELYGIVPLIGSLQNAIIILNLLSRFRAFTIFLYFVLLSLVCVLSKYVTLTLTLHVTFVLYDVIRCDVLRRIVSYCTALYCASLYCIVLYIIVL